MEAVDRILSQPVHMNENEYIAGTVCDLLGRGSPLVLARIVRQDGSAPRHIGTGMVIGAGGKAYGTIGGGALEAGTIKEAGEVLRRGRSKLIDFDLTNPDADLPGMICGGTATVMLEYVNATGENIDFFRDFYDMTAGGTPFTAFTLFRDVGPGALEIGRCLLTGRGEVGGRCPVPESDLERLISGISDTGITRLAPVNDWQVLVEPVRKFKTVYCFGAGHVSRPTAHIAAMAGFRVAVIDDRADFASRERFPDAWKVIAIDDYSEALEGLDIDEDSFIIIFTHGHLHDRAVLEQALKSKAGYIGMIGSRRKRDSVFRALIGGGAAPEQLARVHCPIGLEIGAETPEEIAVSIVAELIRESSGKTHEDR
jgi:xanthine dehydrogenase accessory factor